MNTLHLPLPRLYRVLASYVGFIWSLTALVILSPMLLIPFYGEERDQLLSFLLPALGLGLPGLALWRLLRAPAPSTLKTAHGMAVVVLAWIGAVVAASLPFLSAGGLNVTQAVFEATSGLTTTGLSVVDVTQASHLLLFYRSALELAGGAGLAILMIALIGGPPGSQLAAAEGRGEQLVPHVRASARLVVSMYGLYALVGTLALWAAGMDLFDAVNHAFAAISTGGFSTRPESIGAWDSPALELVTCALMLLGTTNFVAALALAQGKLRVFLERGETRLMLLIIPLAVAVLFVGAALPLYHDAPRALRVAVFEVISALSTTGFSTVGYSDWSDTGWWVLIALMLIGGGTGSTAGGIKQARVYALWRVAVWTVQDALLPRGAAIQPRLRRGGQWINLDRSDLTRSVGFVALYLGIFGIGTLAMTSWGYSLRESLFEMASTLGTVGLSVGVTAADSPAGMLWMQSAAMILGRLEIFALIVGVARLLQDARFALR